MILEPFFVGVNGLEVKTLKGWPVIQSGWGEQAPTFITFTFLRDSFSSYMEALKFGVGDPEFFFQGDNYNA
jgi:hypothetical protein